MQLGAKYIYQYSPVQAVEELVKQYATSFDSEWINTNIKNYGSDAKSILAALIFRNMDLLGSIIHRKHHLTEFWSEQDQREALYEAAQRELKEIKLALEKLNFATQFGIAEIEHEMENGGKILLDEEKKAVIEKRAYVLERLMEKIFATSKTDSDEPVMESPQPTAPAFSEGIDSATV